MSGRDRYIEVFFSVLRGTVALLSITLLDPLDISIRGWTCIMDLLWAPPSSLQEISEQTNSGLLQKGMWQHSQSVKKIQDGSQLMPFLPSPRS